MLWNETLVTAQGDGATLTAAAAASCIPPAAKFTLKANFFENIGKALRVEASGRISSVITTPGTARFDFRLGGTVVFDGLAVLLDTAAAYTTVGWTLDMILTCRAIGTSATVLGQGLWTSTNIVNAGTAPTSARPAILPWNSAPAVGNTFDSTVSQTADLFFTQTVATGSLSLHTYTLSVLN